MFHWNNNLYFGRKSDGSVRVLKFKGTPSEWPKVDREYEVPELELDVTIPPNEWASIVASCSAGGEHDGGWQRALNMHNGKPDPEKLLELVYSGLRLLVDRIERCGASVELTQAVILCSDLASAVGNQYNKRDEYAQKRVRDALEQAKAAG